MRPIRILLVDDDDADVLLTRRAFSQTHFRLDLSVVSSGEEAMAYLNRAGSYTDAVRPDLVLLDLNLPGRGGLFLLKEIKSSEPLRAIPVVVLTTSGSPVDIQHAYARHANSFVRKPVNLDAFLQVIYALSHFWFSVAQLPPART